MNNLQQTHVLYTNKYIIEIYQSADNTINLSDNLELIINNLKYPKDIVEYIEKTYGVKQITVKDLNNNILLVSYKGV